MSIPSTLGLAATFACLSLVFDLPFGSQALAQTRLEDPERVEDVGSEKKPEELKWAVTLYTGVFAGNNLGHVVGFSATYEDSYIEVLALSWQFFRLGDHIRLEVEGQVGKHFGDQDHWELNALGIARWVTFPWNAYLPTTFAAGEGISYATQVPELEAQQASQGASQVLNYLLFEITVALPNHPEWALVGRIHHRSGFWGALAPNSSNIVGGGLKYRF